MLGAGGLGSPALLYLAAAGVGHIRVIDSDALDLTNLQRQVLFRTADISRPKADLAQEQLLALNPEIQIEAIAGRLVPENAKSYLVGSDLVLEGFDNFPSKFLASDACVLYSIPFISSGILRFQGQLLGVKPRETPCLRCIFFEPPRASLVPACDAAGVIGALAGLMGSLMALEAIKILTNTGDLIFGKMIRAELLRSSIRTIALLRRVDCQSCGDFGRFEALNPERYAEGPCLPVL